MAYDSSQNLAGPIEFDPAVIERDAMVREDNDGDRIDEDTVRKYVVANRDRIFGLQTSFFTELRDRLSNKK